MKRIFAQHVAHTILGAARVAGISIVALAGAIHTGCSPAPPPSSESGRPAENGSPSARADALLAEILDRDGGSGVQAAVRVDGELIWSGAVGSADLEAGIDLRPDHRLRVGSVSKPITAVLALRLAEEGILDLDAPIARYVPGYLAAQDAVTVRRLGSHTAGVRQYDFSNYTEANNVLYHPRLVAALDAFRDDPLVAVPGTRFHYSSLGFNLIGMAIEEATGAAFGEVLASHIAEPLGLTATRAHDSLALIPNRARFYTVTRENPMMPWMRDGELINTIFRDDSDLYPSGGLLSNAEELAAFAEAVFETDILTPESRQLLTDPARLRDGEPVTWNERGIEGAYSFGWGIFPTAGGVSLGHGGETNGAFALVRYWPGRRMALGAVTNYNSVDGETAFFELAGESVPELFVRP